MTQKNGHHKAIAYIALGSNLDSPIDQVTTAVKAIEKLQSTHITAHSPWYHSLAIGPGDQPDYINGVIAVETGLSPIALLDELQKIESAQGRERHLRWTARTLDLDILLFDNQEIESDRLKVPHPRLSERNFVLYPLSDIASDLILPNGTTIQSLLASTSTEGLVKMTTTKSIVDPLQTSIQNS
ncbi:MAG: 2-amino-4-hydroxy-6-hydroxymethyldihydropteridine diphosphokinase [Cellvibrionaceae bacterium]